MKAVTAAVLTLAATSAHSQVIETVSPPTVPRNDRLIITGTDFGVAQGDGAVTIGGVDAIVSFWSNERIHAYVPIAAPLNTVDVQVFAPGASNVKPLRVLVREPGEGRIRWRFRADANMVYAQPAVGPDGTVYCTDLYGHMYALAADGELKWIVRANGASGPSVGPDGTIYVGGGGTVKALNPDGTERWRFIGSGSLFGGPNVGPDGNIYGATGGYTGEETGAFVLSPDGDLLFNYPGLNFRHAPSAWEVSFGPGGKWFVTSGMGWPTVGIIGLLAFTADDGLDWIDGGLGQSCASQSGNVYVNNPQDNAVTSYDADGNLRWHFPLNDLPGGSPSPPRLGPDETFYVPTSAPWRFNAIAPDGTLRWSVDPHHTAAWPVVRPDGAMIVTGGYAPSYPEFHVVQAFDPADGSILWTVDLPFADASWKVAQQWYGDFSADGRTVYIPTSGTEAGEPHAFVYAIDTTIAIGDVNDDGITDFADLLAVLASWGPCVGCAADLDGSGIVDFTDLLLVLSNWG